MGKYANEMVKLMQSWIGKKESNGTHKAIIDIYNAHRPLARGYKVKYTDEWCATTVSAAAIKLGYTDIIPTECGCGQMIQLFKNIGCWVENDGYVPSPGDVIFYDWGDTGKGDDTGWPEHVGVVEKVLNGTITVIEGNYNCAVQRRNIKVNGKYIRGYGVPKYDKEPVVVKPAASTKSLVDWANEVKAGKHGTGHANREASLKKAGCQFPYEQVRAKVNELCGSVKPATPAKPAVSYYKKHTGASLRIDVVFKEIGVPSKYIGDYKKRKPVAAANGISNYSGSLIQNTKLVTLAKQGKLKKA